MRSDGSNTISITTYADPQKEAEWEEARRYIDAEKRRLRINLPVAEVASMRQARETELAAAGRSIAAGARSPQEEARSE